jgi:hypothetical protein
VIAIIVLAVLGFLLMAGSLVMTLRQCHAPARVDYKERWLQAVSLLGETGRLTDEQVASLRGEAPVSPPQPPPLKSAPVLPAVTQDQQLLPTQRTLHALAPWARRDLEVARARQGLPPLDDLAGLPDWAITQILKARLQHGTG